MTCSVAVCLHSSATAMVYTPGTSGVAIGARQASARDDWAATTTKNVIGVPIFLPNMAHRRTAAVMVLRKAVRLPLGRLARGEPASKVTQSQRIIENCRSVEVMNSMNTMGQVGTGQPVILMTAPYAAGWKVDKVLGMAYGITVRSRGLGGNIVAGLRTLGGGEIKEYTQLAHQARQEALDRLAESAKAMGANAVISVDFDSTELATSMTEIIAFGTAVVVSPVSGSQEFVRLS